MRLGEDVEGIAPSQAARFQRRAKPGWEAHREWNACR